MLNEITDGKLLPLLLYDLYIQNKFFVVASNYKLMNKLGAAIHCHMFSISWFKLSIPSLFGFVSTWTFVFVPSKAEGETSCQKNKGQKQRLAAISTAESTKSSVLVTWLEEQWAWGFMSAQCFQKIASLALQGMVACGVAEIPPALQKLASIGTFGQHSENCHRDLMNGVSRKPGCVYLCRSTLLWKMVYICSPSCCLMSSSIACGKGTMHISCKL